MTTLTSMRVPLGHVPATNRLHMHEHMNKAPRTVATAVMGISQGYDAQGYDAKGCSSMSMVTHASAEPACTRPCQGAMLSLSSGHRSRMRRKNHSNTTVHGSQSTAMNKPPGSAMPKPPTVRPATVVRHVPMPSATLQTPV